MTRSQAVGWALALALLGPVAGSASVQDKTPPADSEGIEFFEKKIRPVLAEKCYSCHSAQAAKLKGNLRLDTREGVLKGGDLGPAIKPGDPDGSLLLKAVRYKDEELQMPPKEKLSEAVVTDFEAWIRRGAPDPRGAAGSGSKPAIDLVAGRKHWAFQPPKEVALPAVKGSWAVSPIDRFVLGKLEEKGFAPAPEADRRTLLRRVSFDLTGLPPTPEEVDGFLADRSPQAFEKVVDRLLASPAYGERWARHWLDIARYSDTKGYVFQEERRYPFSFTYRDWVIRVLNEDMPYDRFVTLQLAADRVVQGEDKRDLAAMGFLTLGRRFLNRLPDIIDDRIDVVTRGLMGLTVSCARCHDHKYDPIPTKDYYSLYGVFSSSQEPKNLPSIAPPLKTPETLAYEKELADRQGEVSKYREQQHARLTGALRKKETLSKYFLAAHEAGEKKDDNALRAIGQKYDVSGFVASRWSEVLRKSPVFGPWRAYAALGEKDFAEKAGAVDLKDANPKVAAALAPPPASLKDAADRYAALLAGIDRAEAHADPAEEALRQILRGKESPAEIALADVEKLYTRAERDKQRQLERKIEELKATHAGAPQQGMVLEDLPQPQEPHVFVRGNPNTPGERVPRQFPAILSPPQREPFKDGSGRLELARAITSRDNPLTARVIVNRVWMHHFGQGLVRTPSDFGTRSDPPTHPELLDWLARRFLADGGSLKKLHRLIVLSATYRQSSDENPKAFAADPENRLLWHQNRRRLDFEAMRDALLAASGQLDRTMGGRPVPMISNPTAKTRMEAETIKVDVGDPTQDSFSRRRSIYLFVDRQNLPGTFRVFDFASPDTHSPQRYETTVPQQALFLMNNPFVLEQARTLAARPEVAGASSADGRLQGLYRILYGRTASAPELALARKFVELEERAGAQPVASGPWQYGTGEIDETDRRVKGFRPLPHFTGSAWQGGPKLPDPVLGWAILTAEGGHPGGTRKLSAVRRWTSPRDGVVAIEGTLAHRSADGDGVHARIISSAHGELASWTAHNTEAETKMSRVEVAKGDTLDFVVECRANENADSFGWAPVVRLIPPAAATAGNAAAEWRAQADFAGPPGKPRRPLAALEKLAHVLLLANEFMFVD